MGRRNVRGNVLKCGAAHRRRKGHGGHVPIVSISNEANLDPQVRHQFNPDRQAGAHFHVDFAGVREHNFFKIFSESLMSSLAEFTNSYAHMHVPLAKYYGDKHRALKEKTVPEM